LFGSTQKFGVYVLHTISPISFSAVTIISDRVRLVPLSAQYSSVIFKEFTDEITRYMVPVTPSNIGEIDEFIHSSIKSMDSNVDLIFVILRIKSNEFLGVCGLHGKSTPDEPVLGIWLKKDAHGNHYGVESIKLLVEWARKNLIFRFLVYPCDKDNIPSRLIAEKLNGVIFRNNEVKSMSGRILNEVAYKIF